MSAFFVFQARCGHALHLTVYVVVFLQAEYELARRVSMTYSMSESVQYQLTTGAFEPRAFVSQVAGAGRLQVLATSGNWPKKGVIRP